MLCAYLYGTRDLRLVDRPPAEVGSDDIRVAVSCSGICGTELHQYAGMVFGAPATEPRPFGHEFAGRVVEVGADVTAFTVGDRVTAIPGGPCNQCELCRIGRQSMCPNRVSLKGGSWAPTIVLPAQIAWRLPDEVSDRAGALTEPLACAIRAVDRSTMRTGDRVCVIGAGPIGIFVAAMAKAAGASSLIVSEPRAFRRDLAKRLGADLTVDPTTQDLRSAILDVSRGMGADVVFEAVGLPQTIEQAISLAAPGGTVVIVGVADATAQASFSPQELFFKELTIRGTKGVTHGIDRALRWLGRGNLEQVITHTRPLAQAREAVELALSGDAGKVYLTP
jgi:2-desacetyl-2-hydroxyethyl bacteriochlorophyllide A dehydrogenase